jgi:hypothetical protein
MTRVTKQIHECECAICQAGSDTEISRQHRQMNVFMSRLNEPQRRWYVGMLSQQAGGATDQELSQMTGLDEKTIRRGRRELEGGLNTVPEERQRQAGGGRPRAEKKTRS